MVASTTKISHGTCERLKIRMTKDGHSNCSQESFITAEPNFCR
jgi:hypothetical protein